jgi:hypothetical protein
MLDVGVESVRLREQEAPVRAKWRLASIVGRFVQKAPSQGVGQTAVQSSRIETETDSNTRDTVNARETPEIALSC